MPADVPWTARIDLVGSFVDGLTCDDMRGNVLFEAIEGLSLSEARSVICELWLRDFCRRHADDQRDT